MRFKKGLPRTSDSAYLKSCSNLGRKPSLCSTQDDVQELLRRRHRLDILPGGFHGGYSISSTSGVEDEFDTTEAELFYFQEISFAALVYLIASELCPTIQFLELPWLQLLVFRSEFFN